MLAGNTLLRLRPLFCLLPTFLCLDLCCGLAHPNQPGVLLPEPLHVPPTVCQVLPEVRGHVFLVLVPPSHSARALAHTHEAHRERCCIGLNFTAQVF